MRNNELKIIKTKEMIHECETLNCDNLTDLLVCGGGDSQPLLFYRCYKCCAKLIIELPKGNR